LAVLDECDTLGEPHASSRTAPPRAAAPDVRNLRRSSTHGVIGPWTDFMVDIAPTT
jgi:hypothetical protein